MSTRERWIVYPLLFLTLGIVLHDKYLGALRLRAGDLMAGEIAAPRIRCDELQVGRVVICNGAVECRALAVNGPMECRALGVNGPTECRALVVKGPNGGPVVIAAADSKSHNGQIETLTALGVPLVQLVSGPSGGLVVTTGQAGKISGIVGDISQPVQNGDNKSPSSKPQKPKQSTNAAPKFETNAAANQPSGKEQPQPAAQSAPAKGVEKPSDNRPNN